MDQLDGPAGQTSWTNQFFLFEALASLHIRRFPFSLCIVAASESDEGLVFIFIVASHPLFLPWNAKTELPVAVRSWKSSSWHQIL